MKPLNINKHNERTKTMNYYNDNDNLTIKDIIGGIFGGIAFIGFFYGLILLGSAWEDHQRCLNGATEYCIPEDK